MNTYLYYVRIKNNISILCNNIWIYNLGRAYICNYIYIYIGIKIHIVLTYLPTGMHPPQMEILCDNMSHRPKWMIRGRGEKWLLLVVRPRVRYLTYYGKWTPKAVKIGYPNYLGQFFRNVQNPSSVVPWKPVGRECDCSWILIIHNE